MILSQILVMAMNHFSSRCDTIDHDYFFSIFERYLGIGGSAMRLIPVKFLLSYTEFKVMDLCLI